MEDDQKLYSMAVKELEKEPVQGPTGVYHTKNGYVFLETRLVPIRGFASSEHSWYILH